jgi:integrase
VYAIQYMHMPSRKRSPHPGIVVLKPQPETRRPALIRWRDPQTGKFKTEKLPNLPSMELRKWLRKRSYELEGQRLKTPLPPLMPKSTASETVRKYFEEVRLRRSTTESYARSTGRLLEWPELPKSFEEFTLPHLRALRAWLNAPHLAPASVNFHLRQLAVVFEHSRLAGRTPRLSSQDIQDGLATFRVNLKKKVPLSVPQLRALVIALSRFIGEAQSDVPAEAPGQFRGYVLTLLLSGMRAGEARALTDANLAPDHIWLTEDMTKTARARKVTFWESPTLPLVFKSLPRSGSMNTLFGLTRSQTHRLRARVDVPFDWTFQQLRVTCGSYLTCAPGIYSGASAYLSAARLGHSVTIAERCYVGTVEVSPSAKTLEEAYGIADLL